MQIQSSDVPLTFTICAHARKVGGRGREGRETFISGG